MLAPGVGKPLSLQRWLWQFCCCKQCPDGRKLRTRGPAGLVDDDDHCGEFRAAGGDELRSREGLTTCLDPVIYQNHPLSTLEMVSSREERSRVASIIRVGHLLDNVSGKQAPVLPDRSEPNTKGDSNCRSEGESSRLDTDDDVRPFLAGQLCEPANNRAQGISVSEHGPGVGMPIFPPKVLKSTLSSRLNVRLALSRGHCIDQCPDRPQAGPTARSEVLADVRKGSRCGRGARRLRGTVTCVRLV